MKIKNYMIKIGLAAGLALSISGCSISQNNLSSTANNFYNNSKNSISKGIDYITPNSNFLGGNDTGLSYGIKKENQISEIGYNHSKKQVLSTANIAKTTLGVVAKNSNENLDSILVETGKKMQSNQNIDRVVGGLTDIIKYSVSYAISRGNSSSSTSTTQTSTSTSTVGTGSTGTNLVGNIIQ